jgi:ATP-dependent RNA helicase RhlE
MSFSKLGLSAEIVRAVTAKGYTEPTPIQKQAIPVILGGRDLLAGAQTGTGKTAGFTLPILQRLSARSANGPSRSPVRTLILTPTRELAAQVEESVRDYGKFLNISSMTVFGGVNINPQIRRLKSRVDVLVATPGRLLDHVQQRTVDLSHVEILVLDEADRMLDMGFIRDIRKILAILPRQRQNLLFSATFSDEIKDLANKLLNDPALVEVARRNTSAELIEQQIYRCTRTQKPLLLTHLIKEHNWYQVLVFTRTKHGADRLAKQLISSGISSLAIHGNKSQSMRTKTLAKFKAGEVQVLVATDIAARGIDINDLPQVVNFDLPEVPEDYVHRIGRTGRAGSSGGALSLVSEDEVKLLRAIERLINRKLPTEIVPGFEPPARGSAAEIADREPPREQRHHQRDGRSGRDSRPSRDHQAPRDQSSRDQSSRDRPSSSTPRPRPVVKSSSDRRSS